MILLNEGKIIRKGNQNLSIKEEGQDFLSEAKSKFEKTKNETESLEV
jgi:hypothetical protein